MNREKVYSIYDVICLNVFLHKFYNEISLLKTEYNLSAILLKFLLIAVDFFMHQSIPAAPSRPIPPPGLLRGMWKFCAARRPGIWQPRGQPRAFNTNAASCQNITTQRILLKKQADWLICQEREKNEEVCKGMFSILCMHFLIAYQSRIKQQNSGAIDINQRVFGNWIKFLLILFEEHPFIFIKLFIAVSFTAHY